MPVVVDQATTAVTEGAAFLGHRQPSPNSALLQGLRRPPGELARRLKAYFVVDPRAAVADAAELVEHTAQTLIGSLQQRQRQLRRA